MVVSAAMSDLEIATPTSKSTMSEVRAGLEAALREAFPGGMLKWDWDGDVCQLHGAGAKGTIALEAGQLVGRAHLGVPASMMRPLIEQKISHVMKKAAS